MSKPNTTPPTAISAEEKRLNRARLRLAVLKELRALLRKRHETWNLSQRQLAERLGTDEARVSRILNGDENLTLNTVADFFRALEAMPTVKGELFEAVESKAQTTTTMKSADARYVVLFSGMRRSVKNQGDWQVSFEGFSNWLSDSKAKESLQAYHQATSLFSSYGTFTAENDIARPKPDPAGTRAKPRTATRVLETVN